MEATHISKLIPSKENLAEILDRFKNGTHFKDFQEVPRESVSLNEDFYCRFCGVMKVEECRCNDTKNQYFGEEK